MSPETKSGVDEDRAPRRVTLQELEEGLELEGQEEHEVEVEVFTFSA